MTIIYYYSKVCLGKEINIFIRKKCIKLFESDCKELYNVTKYIFLFKESRWKILLNINTKINQHNWCQH